MGEVLEYKGLGVLSEWVTEGWVVWLIRDAAIVLSRAKRRKQNKEEKRHVFYSNI